MRLYRFRNAEQMMRFEEIEKKNMFFAHSSKLNDPMEGISDIVWNGDSIAWYNLFKNYCMNLTRSMLFNQIAIFSDDEDCRKHIKIIRAGFIRSNPYYSKICQSASQFTKNEYVKITINYLVNRDVREYELLTLLKCVHPIALDIVLKNCYISKDEYPFDVGKLLELYNFDDFKLHLKRTNNDSLQQEDSFRKMRLFFDGVRIANLSKSIQKESTGKTIEDILFLIDSYPGHYIKEIANWCLPNYFMTCFAKGYENSSMWGYYADAHKGVCLIYDIPEELELEIKTPPVFGLPYGEKKKLNSITLIIKKG